MYLWDMLEGRAEETTLHPDGQVLSRILAGKGGGMFSGPEYWLGLLNPQVPRVLEEFLACYLGIESVRMPWPGRSRKSEDKVVDKNLKVM